MIKIKYCLKIYLVFVFLLSAFHFYFSFLSSELCIWNEGVAFGLFSDIGSVYLSLTKLMLLSVTVAVLWKNMVILQKYWEILLALIIGSLGNIVDRFVNGGVCDYISILKLPVFNTNDILITISLTIIFILLIYEEACSKRTE